MDLFWICFGFVLDCFGLFWFHFFSLIPKKKRSFLVLILGVLCSECSIAGMVPIDSGNTACVACDPINIPLVVLLGFCVLAFVIYLHLFGARSKQGRLKLFFYFMQLAHLIASDVFNEALAMFNFEFQPVQETAVFG